MGGVGGGLTKNMAAAGIGDEAALRAKGDATAKLALEGKLAARAHDEVNVVLVALLLVLTMWCFLFHSPFGDALEVRSSACARGGILTLLIATNSDCCSCGGAGQSRALLEPRFASSDPAAAAPIYFWLATKLEATAGWSTPTPYVWLTWGGLAYSVLDILYILVVPACTTKAATVIPHHIATITLTAGGWGRTPRAPPLRTHLNYHWCPWRPLSQPPRCARAVPGALHYGVEPLSAHCMVVELNTFILTLKNVRRAPDVARVSGQHAHRANARPLSMRARRGPGKRTAPHTHKGAAPPCLSPAHAAP